MRQGDDQYRNSGDIPEYARRGRKVAGIVLIFAYGNFLFHVIGGMMYDIISWPIYPKLPIYEFSEAIRSIPQYTHKIGSFVEFVLGIYVLMAISTGLLVFLFLRRIGSWLGGVEPENVENIKYTIAVGFFYFSALSPYFPLWFTDTQTDKLISFPLSIQMFWQSTIWAIVVCALSLWVITPWSTYKDKR